MRIGAILFIYHIYFYTFFKCSCDFLFCRYAYNSPVTAAIKRLVKIKSFIGLESDFGGPNRTMSIAFRVIFDR